MNRFGAIVVPDPIGTIGATVPSRYSPSTVTGSGGGSGGAGLYNPVAITKNPWLRDFVGSLQNDLSKTAMPDFTEALNALKLSQGNVNTAFDRYGTAMNLGDFSAAQRGGDAELRARTGVLGADVAALGDRYSDVLADYEKRGAGALDNYLASANDFTNRLVPEGVRLGQAAANRNMSLWEMNKQAAQGGGGGGSSAGVALASRTATEAALPWLLRGNEAQREALGRYQPFYGDVASRQAGKISNFDYPAAAAMYDRYGNVISQEKNTAANIQQLQMAVAREGVDMAIRKHVTDFQSAQMMAQIANMPLEVIMQRAQAAGVLGGMSPMYQYEGLEYTPGATPTPPQYYNQSLPAYPVSDPGYPAPRYGPPGQPNIEPVNNVGGWPSGTTPPSGYVSRGNPTWDAQYGYVRQPVGGQTPSFGGPNDGGGYVNGRYLGTDAWRNNV